MRAISWGIREVWPDGRQARQSWARPSTRADRWDGGRLGGPGQADGRACALRPLERTVAGWQRTTNRRSAGLIAGRVRAHMDSRPRRGVAPYVCTVLRYRTRAQNGTMSRPRSAGDESVGTETPKRRRPLAKTGGGRAGA